MELLLLRPPPSGWLRGGAGGDHFQCRRLKKEGKRGEKREKRRKEKKKRKGEKGKFS